METSAEDREVIEGYRFSFKKGALNNLEELTGVEVTVPHGTGWMAAWFIRMNSWEPFTKDQVR